jgi:hypothetical protein
VAAGPRALAATGCEPARYPVVALLAKFFLVRGLPSVSADLAVTGLTG